MAARTPARAAVTRKAYPLQEASRVLGVSSKTLRRLAAAGEFKLGRLGAQRMVPASFVERYDSPDFTIIFAPPRSGKTGVTVPPADAA